MTISPSTKLLSTLLFMLLSIELFAAPENNKIDADKYCLGCHGTTGLSINPLQPNLDGLPKSYLVSQLIAFEDNTRQHPTMDIQVADLNKDTILELAAFFEARPFQRNKPKGALLIGISKFNTCIGCHGVNGEGRGKYPRLVGLQPAYISKQLKDYQGVQRKNATMSPIAKTLSDQDIKELASYIGSL